MNRHVFTSHRQVRHCAMVTNRRLAHPCPSAWTGATLRAQALVQAIFTADRKAFWETGHKAS